MRVASEEAKRACDDGIEKGDNPMLRITKLIVVPVLALTLSGCAGMSAREQRMLSGGAIGAGAGAAIGAITGGSPAVGAAVGGAAGVVGGVLVDEHEKRH